MAYKLQTRESRWLEASKLPANVGPGVYQGANVT